MSTGQIDTTPKSAPPRQATNALRPYPPSLVDRLISAIARLPLPFGLAYLTLFTLQSLGLHVLAWMDGAQSAFTFDPRLLLLPLWLWGPLAVIAYLNKVSLAMLSDFGPLLDLQPEAMQRLKSQFTTLPPRSVLLSGVFWAGVYLAIIYAIFDSLNVIYGYGPFLMAFSILVGLVTFSIGGVVYYHTFRHLRLLSQTVKRVKQFDLFVLQPVYAVSILTSRTGIAWVFLLSATLLLFPIQSAFVPTLILLSLQVGLALGAFGLPLVSVSLRLLAEKGRLLADNDQRFKLILDRLHRCLDNDELGNAAELKNGIDALNIERNLLTKVPVLPWRPGLLTGFLSVVTMPIILFLTQYALGKLLGG